MLSIMHTCKALHLQCTDSMAQQHAPAVRQRFRASSQLLLDGLGSSRAFASSPLLHLYLNPSALVVQALPLVLVVPLLIVQ